MAQNINKTSVAIYPGCYLTISMTFVYAQLKAIVDHFEPIVLASSVGNLDLFPFEPVYAKRKSFLERCSCKLYKTLSGRAVALSSSQKRLWRSALEKHDVRLIHAHFGPSGLEVLPLARTLGIPLLTTFHGSDASRRLKEKTYVSNLSELFEYAHVITVSKLMADRLIATGADPSKVEVLYCGIPVDEFKYIQRVPLREKAARGNLINLLQVSNFMEKKGHEYTIRAFHGFLNTYPNSRLIFGGDGPLRPTIENLCNTLGVKNKVEFLGKVTKQQVIPLMHEADMFVHHSVTAANGDQEGIPTAIMEAMSTGLVAISTYHSGIPELVDDGITGYLVREKDVEHYTEKMVAALSCGNDLGERASAKVKAEFNMDIQKDKLVKIYRKLIHEN